ncbi:peptidoglycan hydrolase-like protein with peptidoglycan-binding domain [Paenibacillus forsythiae]|uniref:Peptidoglycan hydrolase-like protein with peptidoglycan-binding domain n=1 Tax=Paenibacillus forsythiae TaxID=365616 RepID=A0ABU3HED7_9BACL|nr:phage tail tip lysozyme [Paenibacillus forsythiae]MDT3429178.1 peptidoglycan hydrolase-like protein with peptidoglycan-binding domain [Paenibacillus forsythiae]
MTTAVITRPIIKRGSKGQDVARIQTLLQKAGFTPGTVDSDFGSKTDEAVRNFQKANNLEVDGIVGKDTWALLQKYAGGPVNDTPKSMVHTVQEGETFWTIGKKWGVSDDAIQKANPNLNPTNLQVGTQVVIPNAGGTGNDTSPSGDKTVYAKPTAGIGGLTDAQLKANVLYIYNYMTAKGWTKNAIAGLLGNIEQESGFNPGAWQVRHRTGAGYGLVQWTPARNKFLKWMGNISAEQADYMALNDPKKLMDKQLEYLLIEIKEIKPDKREWIPTTGYNSPYKMTSDEYIHSDKNVGDLALVFHGSFERSADTWKTKQVRVDNAKKWYKFLI